MMMSNKKKSCILESLYQTVLLNSPNALIHHETLGLCWNLCIIGFDLFYAIHQSSYKVCN